MGRLWGYKTFLIGHNAMHHTNMDFTNNYAAIKCSGKYYNFFDKCEIVSIILVV